MANQLWSDLLIGSGQLWSDLDSAPGIVTPGPAVLTLNGQVPAAAQPTTVFRTPTPALLTLSGLSLSAPVTLIPAAAVLSAVGQIPAQQLIRTITNALAPAVESPPTSFAPTLITIWTTQPGIGQLTLQTLEINVTQGGNIGFVSPAPAELTLQTLPYSLLVLAGGAGLGSIQMLGLAPTILRELTISPDIGQVSLNPVAPELALPFTWVDDDPAPTRTWITDAAA